METCLDETTNLVTSAYRSERINAKNKILCVASMREKGGYGKRALSNQEFEEGY